MICHFKRTFFSFSPCRMRGANRIVSPGSGPVPSVDYTNTVDIDIYFLNRQAGKFFHSVLDCFTQILTYRSDADSVRHDDMKINRQTILRDFHMNAVIQALPAKQLGETVFHADSGHSDNAEILNGLYLKFCCLAMQQNIPALIMTLTEKGCHFLDS